MSETTAGSTDPGDLEHYDGLEDLPEETGADGLGADGTGTDGTGNDPIDPGDVIDIADESGPALTTGVDDVDSGSSGGRGTASSGPAT